MKLINSVILGIALFHLSACQQGNANIQATSAQEDQTIDIQDQPAILADSIQVNNDSSAVVVTPAMQRTIKADLDGDGLLETINFARHEQNGKSGLEIIYAGNNKIDSLGFGTDVFMLGLDDLDWVGIFEIAPKGETYYDNVNEEGEIITEEEVPESDKIKLENDGIFIHAAESCGGGVIYLKNGKYAWIQQE